MDNVAVDTLNNLLVSPKVNLMQKESARLKGDALPENRRIKEVVVSKRSCF